MSDLSRELEAEVERLQRQRERFDCRYAGKYAEMSGSHCPVDNPCQRCRLERAEAKVERLQAELKFAHGFDGTIHSTYTMRLEDRGPDVRVIKFGWAVTQQLLDDAEPGALVAHVSMQFRDQLEELLRRAADERHGDRSSPTWGEE